MRVLGIDPGYDRVGVAVLERHNQRDTVLYSACIVSDRSHAIADRLGMLGNVIKKLLEEYNPAAVAVETLFFNKNQKTAVAVAEARGMVLYLAKDAGAAVYEYGPQEIKVAVTGYGKSDKAGVISMLPRLIDNTPKNALDDEYDAIAVGLTHLAHVKNVV